MHHPGRKSSDPGLHPSPIGGANHHEFTCMVKAESVRNNQKDQLDLIRSTTKARRRGGRALKVDYRGWNVPGELPTPVTYTLWIPDGAPHLRGIIVHQHGAGTTASIEGSTAAYDLHWQALAW